MKHILLALASTLIVFSMLKAQSSEDSVKAVINKMFEGMKNSDPILMKEVFADSVIFQTIATTREGKTIVKNERFSGFLEFVSKQKKGSLDEQIQFETIKIDGPLAVVWTPYKFYFNGQFSHCGVNSFHLVRLEGKWKIQYLIDTRRKEGCE